MAFGLTKCGILFNVITHNVVSVNQKTELCVCRWLHARAMFDVTCFGAFVEASDDNSSFMSIRHFCMAYRSETSTGDPETWVS